MTNEGTRLLEFNHRCSHMNNKKGRGYHDSNSTLQNETNNKRNTSMKNSINPALSWCKLSVAFLFGFVVAMLPTSYYIAVVVRRNSMIENEEIQQVQRPYGYYYDRSQIMLGSSSSMTKSTMIQKNNESSETKKKKLLKGNSILNHAKFEILRLEEDERKEENEEDQDVPPVVPSSETISIPPPSKQDWCMAPGQYNIFGTYRGPHNAAEEGFFYAPGRFKGVFFTGQDDESVYFHLVNMTYGNSLAPHRHIPDGDEEDPADGHQQGTEYDKFDAFCTIHPVKPSACYAPKYFPPPGIDISPRQQEQQHKTRNRKEKEHSTPSTSRSSTSRCLKLSFPSMTGFALCRQLAMATFERREEMVTMGPDVMAEEWTARLSTTGNPANDYDGELRLFLRNFSSTSADATEEEEGGTPPPRPLLKVPLTHWLTSDDQTLEASFQVMNHKSWDPTMFPEIPHGCEDAVDMMELLLEKEKEDEGKEEQEEENILEKIPPKSWKIMQEQLLRGGCPFGAMHRHLTLPSWDQSVMTLDNNHHFPNSRQRRGG